MDTAFDWIVAWIVEVFDRAQVDLAVTVLGVLIAFILRDKIWMWIRWGRWQVVIKDSLKPDPEEQELTRRKLSPERARLVLKDPNEMSVFVKGVANPHGPRILLDPVSKESRDIGFLTVRKKVITLDYAHNPKPKQKPNVVDLLPAQIDKQVEKIDQVIAGIDELKMDVTTMHSGINDRVNALEKLLAELKIDQVDAKQSPVATTDSNVEPRDKHV